MLIEDLQQSSSLFPPVSRSIVSHPHQLYVRTHRIVPDAPRCMSRTPQEPTHLEHISAHPQPQPSCTCLGRPATDHRHNQNGDYCKPQRYSDSKSDIQSGRVGFKRGFLVLRWAWRRRSYFLVFPFHMIPHVLSWGCVFHRSWQHPSHIDLPSCIKRPRWKDLMAHVFRQVSQSITVWVTIVHDALFESCAISHSNLQNSQPATPEGWRYSLGRSGACSLAIAPCSQRNAQVHQ